MSGGDVVGALLLSPSEQRAQLEVAVACHAGVGRAAVEIIRGERLDHRLGELSAQVEQRMSDSQMLGNFLGAAAPSR